MTGLKQWKNWRTFLAGFLVGYVVAWGMHWATVLYTHKGYPVHIHIPFLTP
jgi:hypothetical protein